MHRSVFESLMRTLKGHLLYQAEYLSRLLVKPPTTRSEAEVLKLASYLTSLPRFQEVPQSQLVQVAKEVTYLDLTAGAIVCKQGASQLCALAESCCHVFDKGLMLCLVTSGRQPVAPVSALQTTIVLLLLNFQTCLNLALPV